MPERPCHRLTRRQQAHGLTVCTSPTLATPGLTEWHITRHPFKRVTIKLQPLLPGENGKTLACHEFMHALTGIGDADDPSRRFTSCVHGILAAPGSCDIAYARKVYRRHLRRQ